MSERGKIIAIYVTVAVVAVLVLSVSFWLRSQMPTTDHIGSVVTASGMDSPEEWFPIENDLEAVNQAGETVRLSELRGNVWVVAEFFAVCPVCARRNAEDLKALYDKFGNDPDFHIVCISVDPEEDDVEKLKDYAEAFDARVENWWFLTGDRETIHEYLTDELKFLDVRERTDPDEIAALGRYQHDMGIIAVNREMQVMGKRDLAWAGQQSPALREQWEHHLHGVIERELEKSAPVP